MGAKIYTDPIFEPVKVAQVLVSKAKATINTNGETPEPSTPATASPTIAVKPVPASASSEASAMGNLLMKPRGFEYGRRNAKEKREIDRKKRVVGGKSQGHH